VIRQRVRLRRGTLETLVRGLTLVFALVLAYGGVMVALLALKIDPDRIDRISGYRTGYHWLAGLSADNFTTGVSFIAGFGGLLVFLVFAFLALQALPRPYFTRSEVGLAQDRRGATVVRPRAVERVAEVAAQGNDHVIGVTGRLGEGALYVDLGLDDAPTATATLRDVRRRVAAALADHKLPAMPVNVTLTGYEPTRRDSP
jgi:hypothetical protein